MIYQIPAETPWVVVTIESVPYIQVRTACALVLSRTVPKASGGSEVTLHTVGNTETNLWRYHQFWNWVIATGTLHTEWYVFVRVAATARVMDDV